MLDTKAYSHAGVQSRVSFYQFPLSMYNGLALLHGIHIDSMMTLSIKCKILCKYLKL